MKTGYTILAGLMCLCLAGCGNTTGAASTATGTTASTPTATSTPLPSPSATATALPTATVEMALQVCSPLQGIERSQLRLITSYAFITPDNYVESGHPAIDFSFYQFENNLTGEKYTTFANFPVQAILPGKVILIENDRFPYGYMVLIETPFTQISADFSPAITTPTPLPPSAYSTDERCPVAGAQVSYDPTAKSIYTLYAHLASLPLVKTGDTVACGQLIGYAGKTGHAAEDHLHLEVRIGPAHAQFGSIGAYHSSNTAEERYNYCIWALSGIFQAIDPAILLYPE